MLFQIFIFSFEEEISEVCLFKKVTCVWYIPEVMLLFHIANARRAQKQENVIALDTLLGTEEEIALCFPFCGPSKNAYCKGVCGNKKEGKQKQTKDTKNHQLSKKPSLNST